MSTINKKLFKRPNVSVVFQVQQLMKPLIRFLDGKGVVVN